MNTQDSLVTWANHENKDQTFISFRIMLNELLHFIYTQKKSCKISEA